MSNETSTDEAIQKELRILRMVKKTLTEIAKDTQTPPGMRHPLSDNSIQNIRECFTLITARERELGELQGKTSTAKPRFVDEPQDAVVVKFDSSNLRDKK